MREIVTQIAVLFIVWSVAVELVGWTLQYWLGDRWWRKILGERRPAENERQTAPVVTRAE